jgi:hypothetical protein
VRNPSLDKWLPGSLKPRVCARFRWEGSEPLSPGKHTLSFEFSYDGLGFATLAFNNMSGLGRGAPVVLKVDGRVIATQAMEHTIPVTLEWDETLDIGPDTGTPANDGGYQVPLRLRRADRPAQHNARPAEAHCRGH